MPTMTRQSDGTTTIVISSVEQWHDSVIHTGIIERALDMAARDLADKFVAAHGDAVLARISPEAMATVAQAHAAAAVAKFLREGIDEIRRPVRIVEVERRRGWFR